VLYVEIYLHKSVNQIFFYIKVCWTTNLKVKSNLKLKNKFECKITFLKSKTTNLFKLESILKIINSTQDIQPWHNKFYTSRSNFDSLKIGTKHTHLYLKVSHSISLRPSQKLQLVAFTIKVHLPLNMIFRLKFSVQFIFTWTYLKISSCCSNSLFLLKSLFN
jgi:hypothetical protein